MAPQGSGSRRSSVHRSKTTRLSAAVAVCVLFGALATATCAQAQSQAQAQSRGELLYSAHCISCHDTEMHWRDQRVATDWTLLKAQVRRWQGAAALSWTEADIVEVARYLNETIYRFPQTSNPVASATPLPAGPLAMRSVAAR